MTKFKSKHVALFIVLKNKKDCADIYCITLNELQASRDALIQKRTRSLNYTGRLHRWPEIIPTNVESSWPARSHDIAAY